MIYVLEGPDGVGKTTLAAAINEKAKGHTLHCSWAPGWPMEEYFKTVMNAAQHLDLFQDVVIDRWAPSEHVYGVVFRDGPAFPVHNFLKDFGSAENITYVYCHNENAVENHLKHIQKRDEMFDDMTQVVKEFDWFIADSRSNGVKWLDYDYDQISKGKWVHENVKKRM